MVIPAAPRVPGYDQDWLGAVLPGISRSLGVDLGLPAIDLPEVSRVCVVLIDGLGWGLLSEHADQAPFLAGLLAEGGRPLSAGVPTTTATSLASFGTGLPPGRHGLVGYEVLDPDRQVVFNELRWDPEVDPLRWQPFPTVFQRLQGCGRLVTSTGNPEFDGSGFNLAALRGSEFFGATRLAERVDLAERALADPGLFYLYWGGLDSAGHTAGCRSRTWRTELRELDAGLARLARVLPAGTLLVVTADHGMLDVDLSDRVDLAEYPELAAGMRLLAGEPRFVQAHCEPGAADRLARRWAEEFSDRAWVVTREQAIAAGWFGPVDERVVGRIGEVIVAAREPFALVDSRTASRHILSLIGWHGSLTEDEMLVPLLTAVL